MTDKLKKQIILNLPYLIFVYLFDKLCQGIRLAPGADASEKLLHIGQGFSAAFASLAPSFHLLDLCMGAAGAVLIRLAVYSKGKNAKKYRRGIEYGSARWGTPADIAPYADPDFFQNVLLTQTERITMSSRPKAPKYARNKNILVIGGSGSGKTRFFVKPNLLQCHSSYVVTDPKGTILNEVGALLERKGYRIKSLNLINFKKSMRYTPIAYWREKGVNRPGKSKLRGPYMWNSSTITHILSLQEYCGDILNFKTYSKSYKNKKRLANDRENWVIFQDVHEPIIERAVFEQVQQKRGKIRKRRTHEGERNMFSGLLVCADCGHNLHFHFNQGNPDIKYFNCSNYKGNRGTCTSTHYVRVDFLEQVVLGEIRRLTKFASQFEDEFVKAVIGHSQQAEATDRKLKEKELKALQARDEELDGLFERIYEDNVSGKLSDDRFARMSRRYEEEQKELAEKIKALRAEIDKQNSQSMTTDMFISLVRKYTRARKLTPRMLNELIEKIEVFNAEKVDGVWGDYPKFCVNLLRGVE